MILTTLDAISNYPMVFPPHGVVPHDQSRGYVQGEWHESKMWKRVWAPEESPHTNLEGIVGAILGEVWWGHLEEVVYTICQGIYETPPSPQL